MYIDMTIILCAVIILCVLEIIRWTIVDISNVRCVKKPMATRNKR